MSEKIKIKIRAEQGAELPAYATPGSAGMDLRANNAAVIPAGKRAVIGTGLFVELPEGYEIQVRPRSGLAFRSGVTVLNSPGTVDSDYRGEIRVILLNTGDNDFAVERGDRIAQMVIAPVIQAEFIAVDELEATERGEGGFGHTGTK